MEHEGPVLKRRVHDLGVEPDEGEVADLRVADDVVVREAGPIAHRRRVFEGAHDDVVLRVGLAPDRHLLLGEARRIVLEATKLRSPILMSPKSSTRGAT